MVMAFFAPADESSWLGLYLDPGASWLSGRVSRRAGDLAADGVVHLLLLAYRWPGWPIGKPISWLAAGLIGLLPV